MLISLLAVGFLLGLKHALDADHVSAVAALAARRVSLGATLRIAAAWGLGHSVTLFVFGAILVLLETRLPDSVAHLLEAAVGVMLIVLGIDVIRRARRRRIHVHVHTHDGGARHLHLHAHDRARAGRAAARDAHEHDHAHVGGLAPRALLIGCVHGLAGTAGLVLLAIPATQSGGSALLTLFVFGLGTIAGMVVFSAVISVPLTWSARRARRAAFAIDALLGVTNLALGLAIAIDSLRAVL